MTHVLGADTSGLEQLVHALKQHHLGLLQGSVPCQAHGLLDDACHRAHNAWRALPDHWPIQSADAVQTLQHPLPLSFSDSEELTPTGRPCRCDNVAEQDARSAEQALRAHERRGLTVREVCLIAKSRAVEQLLLELQSLLTPDLQIKSTALLIPLWCCRNRLLASRMLSIKSTNSPRRHTGSRKIVQEAGE